MPRNTDDRAAMAKAMDWVSRIISACVMSVLPALGGYFLDNWLGTKIVFILLGMLLGGGIGFYQLRKLVETMNEQSNDPR